MFVHLLYEDRELKGAQSYFDSRSIIDDLGMNSLLHACCRDQERTEDNVQSIMQADVHLSDLLKKVMLIPLTEEKQIVYRQAIMQDLFANAAFLKALYALSRDMIARWDKLGRKDMNKPGSKAIYSGNQLVSTVRILHLFVNTLTQLKKLCRENKAQFASAGMLAFCAELEKDFSDDWEAQVRKILADITFFCDGEEEYSMAGSQNGQVHQAKITLECGVGNGMKLGDMKLEAVETLEKRFKKPKSKKTMVEKMMVTFSSDPMLILKEPFLLEDLNRIEDRVVEMIMQALRPFMKSCQVFFEELYDQTAFYRASYNLYVRSQNMNLKLCYPKVCPQNCLRFENLTEFSMATFRVMVPIGNTSTIDDRMLLIVTGANQGGKSTFLRSLGIAQVMLQCGMFVSAERFESGIFPAFFTHFTRREDSEMNSGRLDEELKRISEIIDHLDDRSMVLLNESFATTTEEEGSVIAYDVVKAMVEAGVKVMTVTHLLSFAKQVYAEQRSDTTFLSAERKEDGSRTYKMIPNEPELTSFGLDLYEKMIV